MGPPGCGKTTVANLLSEKLGFRKFDVDDDLLEPIWATSVASKLEELGDEGFLQAEAKALVSLDPAQVSKEGCSTVISLSGSNPLNQTAMDHVKSFGYVVYLDVPHEDIVNRMHSMKVDRIVGQSGSLKEILEYRESFYEKGYHARVVVEKESTPEAIADKVLSLWNREVEFIDIASKTPDQTKTFDQFLFENRDDSIHFIPKTPLEPFTEKQIDRLVAMPFEKRMAVVMERFPLGKTDPQSFKTTLAKTFENFNTEKVMQGADDDAVLVSANYGRFGMHYDYFSAFYASLCKSSESRHIPFLFLTDEHNLSLASTLAYNEQPCVCIVPDIQLGFTHEKLVSNLLDSSALVLSYDTKLQNDLTQLMYPQLSPCSSLNWLNVSFETAFAFSLYLEGLNLSRYERDTKMHVILPRPIGVSMVLPMFYSSRLGSPIELVEYADGTPKTASILHRALARERQRVSEDEEWTGAEFHSFTPTFPDAEMNSMRSSMLDKHGIITDTNTVSSILSIVGPNGGYDLGHHMLCYNTLHYLHHFEDIVEYFEIDESKSIKSTLELMSLMPLLTPFHQNLADIMVKRMHKREILGSIDECSAAITKYMNSHGANRME